MNNTENIFLYLMLLGISSAVVAWFVTRNPSHKHKHP